MHTDSARREMCYSSMWCLVIVLSTTQPVSESSVCALVCVVCFFFLNINVIINTRIGWSFSFVASTLSVTQPLSAHSEYRNRRLEFGDTQGKSLNWKNYRPFHGNSLFSVTHWVTDRAVKINRPSEMSSSRVKIRKNRLVLRAQKYLRQSTVADSQLTGLNAKWPFCFTYTRIRISSKFCGPQKADICYEWKHCRYEVNHMSEWTTDF